LKHKQDRQTDGMGGQDKTEEKRDDTSNEINQTREILCYNKREKGKKKKENKKKRLFLITFRETLVCFISVFKGMMHFFFLFDF